MSKINFKTNISFLIILISVLVLAFIEGGNISKALMSDNNSGILGNELQQIAFIFLTLIILIVATLKPNREYLTAYSAATLGLVVVLSSFYNLFILDKTNNFVELILGFSLIISGIFMGISDKLSGENKKIAKSGIESYKRTIGK